MQQCCALDASGKLAYEPVVDGVCTLEVTRQPLHARRLHAALGPVVMCALGRARRRELRELSRGHDATPRRGMCCRRLELCRHRRVGVRHRRGKVPRTLLGVAHDVSESTVGRAAAGRAAALVTERCEQWMRESDTRIVDHEHACRLGGLERSRDADRILVECGDQVERWPGQRGDRQQDVSNAIGEIVEPLAQERPQAVRHSDRVVSAVRHAGACQLDGEEGVAARRGVQTRELRSR